MSDKRIVVERDPVLPLVSIGIPTFNRPEGLRRTLEQICAQTYPRLEIIVSDNASTDPMVEEIGRTFAEEDARVTYIRQQANIGAMPNFKHVLRCATGQYFMWAADDDEWSPAFVERCLANSRDGESVACKFDTLFRYTGHRETNPVPALDPDKGQLANLQAFFGLMQPSLIYGLHQRKTLDFFADLPNFDFVDCYFVLQQILGPGLRTIPDVLYTAGVDSATYEIKYSDAKSKKFDYAPFYLRTAWLVLRTQKLGIREKYDALRALKQTIFGLIKHHEGCDDPHPILRAQVKRYWRRMFVPRFVV